MNSIQPPSASGRTSDAAPAPDAAATVLASRRRERSQVVLGSGIMVAMLTILCAGLLLWDARQAQIRDWQQTVANLSTTIVAHAEQTMNAADLVLISVLDLVSDNSVQTRAEFEGLMTTKPVHEALRDKVAGVVQADVASLVTLDGRIINSSRAWPRAPIDVADRDYVIKLSGAAVSGTFLSAPVRNRSTGEWTFFIARQVIGREGVPVGIAIVGLSSQYFQNFYRAANLGEFSAITLFRSDGLLLAREPPLPGMIGQSFPDAAILRDVLPRGGATATIGSPRPSELAGRGGTLRVVAPRTLRGFPMVSNITVTEDVILGTWRRTAWNVALLAFAFVSAVFATTLALMRLFARQDRTLADLVRARGDAEDAAAAKTILIEKLRASERLLSEKSKVLELTLDHMDQGLLMIDADGRVGAFNRRVTELLNVPRSLLATAPMFSAVVDHQRLMGEFVNARIGSDHTPGEAEVMTRPITYERIRPNGTVLEIQTIPLPEGGMVRTFTDITLRRASEAQVRHLAHHDPLTQLANRLVFLRQLTEAIKLAQARRGCSAVLYLDLDGFKLVNDTHGHAIGDQVLVEVAARLRRVVRETDTVARVGGDEFAIIQPLIEQPDAAERLARRVLSAVAAPYRIQGLTCRVGLSIGIALYPGTATTAEHLLREADLALYRAKADGKGVFCWFDPAIDGQQRRDVLLEDAIARGLSAGEFFLEYQPIVNAASMRTVCFEALVRWRQPHGIVPPNEFIPIAERAGLIGPLGNWVLESACHAARDWPPDVGVSVNVSPLQFAQGDLVSEVREMLERTGLDPSRLTLEVTEGVMLEESDRVVGAMVSLRALGVRFSLDDFGTAQTRLTYLKRFPFDVLKIDRSFVHDAVEQEGARAIVGAILAIGRAFHLAVIAEGVETEAELSLLRELGCDMVQGYLTGRPHPAPMALLPAK